LSASSKDCPVFSGHLRIGSGSDFRGVSFGTHRGQVSAETTVGPLRDGRSSEVFRTLYGESHRRSMIIEELQAFMGLLILTELWLHLV
jgi:hypothetical protein